MEKIALAQLKSEDPVWHPAFGECQYMGLADNMQGWVFWSHVDEEGRHKEFVEDDPDAKVLPLGKFLMAWVPIQGSDGKMKMEPRIAKAFSVFVNSHLDPEARISWWRGETISTLSYNENRDSILVKDLEPLWKECKL